MKYFLKLMLSFGSAIALGIGLLPGEGTCAESRVFDLGQVVVTGAAEIVTQVTTVDTVNRETMDLTNATDVSRHSRQFPGVFVSKGRRNEAFLNVRGFSQRYVPIFYDGIPPLRALGRVCGSQSNFSTGNISQITVTKGAASVLYGRYHGRRDQYSSTMKPQKPIEGSYNVELMRTALPEALNLSVRSSTVSI